MTARHLVVVGGGPAALSAVKGYRTAGGDGDVTLLTPEAHLPYPGRALSKGFLRGDVEAGGWSSSKRTSTPTRA